MASACASAPAASPELALDCERLLATAPEATAVPVEDMPRLLNPDDVQRRLSSLYDERVPRRAVVHLLVQPDGRISHGCVRQGSGDLAFDRAALAALVIARFRPGVLDGLAVDAWVALPIGIGL